MKAIALIVALLIVGAPLFSQITIEIRCSEYVDMGNGRIEKNNTDSGCRRDNSESQKADSLPANEHGNDRGSNGNQETSANPQNTKETTSSNQKPGKTEAQTCLSEQELQKLCEEGDLCGDDPLDAQAALSPTLDVFGFAAEMLALDPQRNTHLNAQKFLSKYYECPAPNQPKTRSQVVSFVSEALGAEPLSKDICLNAKQFRSKYRKHFASVVILNLKPLAFFKTKMLVTRHQELIYVTCVFRSKNHPIELAKKKKNPNYIPGSGSHPQRIGVDVLPGGMVFGKDADWRKDSPAYKNYDAKKTQEVVDAIKHIDPDAKLLFNDPQIVGVRPALGHDDHIHITWSNKAICLIPQASSNK